MGSRMLVMGIVTVELGAEAERAMANLRSPYLSWTKSAMVMATILVSAVELGAR